MRNSIYIIVLAMLSMGMMACSGQSDNPDQQNTETPTITIEFSASPAIILANEMATLSWSAEGASSCTIPGIFFSGGEKAKGGAAFFSSLSKEIPLPDLGGEGAPTKTVSHNQQQRRSSSPSMLTKMATLTLLRFSWEQRVTIPIPMMTVY